MLKLLILVLSFLSISCSGELNSPNGDSDVAKVFANSQVQAVISGLDEADRYQVKLIWPPSSHTLRLSVNSKVLATVDASEHSFIHEKVHGGSSLAYTLEQISPDGKTISSTTLNVLIPKDTIITGVHNLKEHSKITGERVFVQTDAVVTTNEFNYTIDAKTLIANGGRIQSFPEGATAAMAQAGRHGGWIQISATEARGHLTVVLRGENGGVGRPGVAINAGTHPGCAGTNGAQGGNSGTLSANFVEGLDLSITVENAPGAAGVAGRRGAANFNTPGAVYPPCHRDMADGVDGQPGSRGQSCIKPTGTHNYECR